MADVAKDILSLKSSLATSVRLRAEAEASLRQAELNRDAIHARLKELGIDPENAEQELAVAESQLDVTIAELTNLLNAEIAQYNEILKVTRSSGG